MAANAPAVTLSTELIEEFLSDQRKKGRSPACITAYRRNLGKLLDFLPPDKRVTADTAGQWRSRMLEGGVAPRSVNARLSALNSFCDYLGHREFQDYDFLEGPEIIQPELSRDEYLRLLNAAKVLEKERTYFLIKVLGGVGLQIQELPQVTVEALQAGSVKLCYHNERCQRTACIPEPLREELLGFAGREGIQSGPIFRTGEGKPILRTYVCKLLRQVSQAAGVDAKKATPRCLWRMYLSTRKDILSHISILADQAYDRILAEEQRVAGWAG